MTRCFVALGSNLGQPLRQVRRALRAMAAAPALRLVAVSSWYRSAALGPGPQPDYVNGVAALDTRLAAGELLRALQAIERRQGRVRRQRWAARSLDLDILLYGERRIDEPGLVVPHPRMRERDFVLRPLAELAPGLTLPCGTSLSSLLARCPRGGARRLDGWR